MAQSQYLKLKTMIPKSKRLQKDKTISEYRAMGYRSVRRVGSILVMEKDGEQVQLRVPPKEV